ncbi:MAG: PKD domain-containing protein, partial [Methanosarcinales archaeon]
EKSLEVKVGALITTPYGFDYPVGTHGYVGEERYDGGDNYYNANEFLGKGKHEGEDWNGDGGGDTDLGDPVYAIGSGKVYNAAEDDPGEGGYDVGINHTLENGGNVRSVYVHLKEDSIIVKKGDEVSRGQKIAQIGKSGGVASAHLHFEIRLNASQEPYYIPNTEWVLVDPSDFIDSHSPKVEGAKLEIGDTIKSKADLEVRLGPGNNYKSLKSEKSGTTGLVVGGPRLKENYIWWKIRWDADNIIGWSAQDHLEKIAEAKFKIGDQVQVYGTGKVGISVRKGPCVKCTYITNKDEGSTGVILAGPEGTGRPNTIDTGYIWWKIKWDNGEIGWSAQDWLTKSKPPIAEFTISPEETLIKEEVVFDASNSYDPDGYIEKYKWDFGDGTTKEGKKVTKAYTEAGEYTVTLTVKDNDGIENSNNKKIKVVSGKEKEFFATVYNIVYESELEGTQKVTKTISGKEYTLKASFLFGGHGVAMQGTGRTGPDGDYIHYDGGGGGLVHINNPQEFTSEVKQRYTTLGVTDFTGFGNLALVYPEDAEYSIVSGVIGASNNELEPWYSIALNRSVIEEEIPYGTTGTLIFLDGTTPSGSKEMKFRVDDTGGGLEENQIDIYVGEGEDALPEQQNYDVKMEIDKKTLIFHSPINITIIDQYNRIISDNGTNEIPFADLILTNQTKIFYIPANLNYSTEISAYSIGTFNFTIIDKIENNISITKFENLSITQNTRAEFEIKMNITNYTLKLDYNGDGAIDEEKSPDLRESVKVNIPPSPSFTYSPENPVVNQTITFNASSSYDPDGNITSYSWNFGDNTTKEGAIVNHSYSTSGNYTVTLTVTDNDNATDTDTVNLTVLSGIKGDFNGNGRVDIGDATYVAYMVVGKVPV